MREARVSTTLALAAPLLPSMILANLTGPIIQLQAAQLGEGLVAAYGYAFRLHSALSQTLVVGLSTVLLPHLAALWSRGETAEIAVLFRRLARWTVPIVAYLCVGIFLMGETTTKILFQRGAFAAANTEQVSWLWILLSLSLLPSAFGTFVAKLCQALRGTGSVLASAADPVCGHLDRRASRSICRKHRRRRVRQCGGLSGNALLLAGLAQPAYRRQIGPRRHRVGVAPDRRHPHPGGPRRKLGPYLHRRPAGLPGIDPPRRGIQRGGAAPSRRDTIASLVHRSASRRAIAARRDTE